MFDITEEKKTYRQIIIEEIKRIENKCENLSKEEQNYWKKVINTLIYDLHEYEKQKRISPVSVEYEDFFDRIWRLIEEEFFGDV